jgi:hypothetical protein
MKRNKAFFSIQSLVHEFTHRVIMVNFFHPVGLHVFLRDLFALNRYKNLQRECMYANKILNQ